MCLVKVFRYSKLTYKNTTKLYILLRTEIRLEITSGECFIEFVKCSENFVIFYRFSLAYKEKGYVVPKTNGVPLIKIQIKSEWFFLFYPFPLTFAVFSIIANYRDVNIWICGFRFGVIPSAKMYLTRDMQNVSGSFFKILMQ